MAGSRQDNESARLLGAELRAHRVGNGMSLRELARRIGLSGHGTLVDYEYGRRIPPEDIVIGYERELNVAGGQLRDLRKKALAELAETRAAHLLVHAPDSAAPTTESELTSSAADVEPVRPAGPSMPRRWRRRVVLILLPLLLLAAGVFALAQNTTDSAPRLRINFADGANRWWVLYGPQVARLQRTTSITYHGHPAELVTVTGASASKGYSAVGISHGLDTLHPGMKVTLHLWVPGAQEGGVSFLVHDSRGANHWAVENQGAGTQQTETPLPEKGGWSTVVWTVPAVDHVTTIGMQIWAENDQPLLVGVADVAW
ncbi:hypothetical protein GCM10029978_111620 [Actinoallomurus acanthiterrae]